jgi:hypothetical protein
MAKNLCVSSPTGTAVAVVALQERWPRARVLYCSATGASQPRHLAYMCRLSTYGYPTIAHLLSQVAKSGMGAMEMFAVGLKVPASRTKEHPFEMRCNHAILCAGYRQLFIPHSQLQVSRVSD